MITGAPSADAVGDEADRALLVRLDHGDSTGFWCLWQKHSGSLLAACLREMKGNRADAEDALGQAMLKALQRLSVCGRHVVRPAAWLMRMVCNLCRDIVRRRMRLVDVARLQQSVVDDIPSAIDARDSVHGVYALIDSLSTPLRDAVVLRFIEQLSYDEIGTRLHISVASARKRVQRARMALLDPGRTAGQRPMYDLPVPAKAAFPYTIEALLPSGLCTEVTIFVDQKPRRVAQKVATLRSYVERHPRGWKMRLKLADLLYSTGEWAAALEAYREVLKKRPGLSEVSQRLTAITTLAQAVARDLERNSEMSRPAEPARRSWNHRPFQSVDDPRPGAAEGDV